MGKKKRQQLDDAIREASGQSSDEVMRMAGVLTTWAVLKQRRFFAAVAEATKDAHPSLASDPPSSTTVRKLAIELAEFQQCFAEAHARLGHQRGVGGHAVQYAQIDRLPYLVHDACIQENFHHDPLVYFA